MRFDVGAGRQLEDLPELWLESSHGFNDAVQHSLLADRVKPVTGMINGRVWLHEEPEETA